MISCTYGYLWLIPARLWPPMTNLIMQCSGLRHNDAKQSRDIDDSAPCIFVNGATEIKITHQGCLWATGTSAWYTKIHYCTDSAQKPCHYCLIPLCSIRGKRLIQLALLPGSCTVAAMEPTRNWTTKLCLDQAHMALLENIYCIDTAADTCIVGLAVVWVVLKELVETQLWLHDIGTQQDRLWLQHTQVVNSIEMQRNASQCINTQKHREIHKGQ